MNLYTVAESTEMIDSYARTPGGATWKTTREARSLEEEVQDAPDQEEGGFQPDAENKGLRELSDAPAVLAIDQDTEVQETPAIVTSLWKLLAYPHAAAAPQGGKCGDGILGPYDPHRALDAPWEDV